MPGIPQQTLNNVIRATGVGLHSGQKVYLTLRPAPEDTGICFIRTDLDPQVEIKATAANVGSTNMATSLASRGAQIRTVEHLMSAFAGLSVDNAIVEVSADELPIMDGSAAPFVFLLQSAGIKPQNALKKFVRILEPVQVGDKDSWVRVEPYAGYRLDYTLHYDHPVFARHSAQAVVEFSTATYIREISRARTFGFLSDYEKLRDMNLAQGGSLENAVVVDDYKILNEEGLRQEDEFAKHKILDAVGDLYLLGHPIIGSFTGYKSGHGPNNALLRTLLACTSAYEITTFEDSADAPDGYGLPFVAAIA